MGKNSTVNFLKTLINTATDNKDVEYFFSKNILIHPFTRLLKNIKFILFRQIDPGIGAYSLTPLMLFYFLECGF